MNLHEDLRELEKEDECAMFMVFEMSDKMPADTILFMVSDDYSDPPEYHFHSTLTELIEDIIDGYACCGGRGVIYNEPRDDKNLDYKYGDSARALVQILRDQADLLEARISDTIPSEEDHVKHRES